MCLTPIKDCNITRAAREVSDTFNGLNKFIICIIIALKHHLHNLLWVTQFCTQSLAAYGYMQNTYLLFFVFV